MGIEDILEIETREADDMSAFAKETRRILRQTRQDMRDMQIRASERNRARYAGRKAAIYKPNDLVLVWDDASAERVPEPIKSAAKLCDKWRGPYRVIQMNGHNKTRVVFLNTERKRQEVAHVHHCAHYYPWKDELPVYTPSVPARDKISKSERREMNATGRTGERKTRVPTTGDLIVFPMKLDQDPRVRLCVGRCIKKTGQRWLAQFYGNEQELQLGPHRPMWKAPGKDSESYYGDRQGATHKPCTTYRMSIKETSIADVGFALTQDHRLTDATLERVEQHEAFEGWTRAEWT